MADPTTILALLYGDRFDQHFAVQVDRSLYVRDLKDAIKARIPDCLVGTSSNQLQLWKVNLQIENDNMIPEIDFTHGTKLSPHKKISDYFDPGFLPRRLALW